MISSGDGIFSSRQSAHRSFGSESVVADSSPVAPAKSSWRASVVDNDEEGV